MDVAQSELDTTAQKRKEKMSSTLWRSNLKKHRKITRNFIVIFKNLNPTVLSGQSPFRKIRLNCKRFFFLSYNSFLFLFLFSNLFSFLSKVTNEDKTKSEELRNIRIRLEQSRSTFSANTSRGRILDGLMEQKRKGTLPGMYGRLGDLGAIDEKFDGVWPFR
jgi:structural maintenance of chromosome 4